MLNVANIHLFIIMSFSVGSQFFVKSNIGLVFVFWMFENVVWRQSIYLHVYKFFCLVSIKIIFASKRSQVRNIVQSTVAVILLDYNRSLDLFCLLRSTVILL